MPPNILRIIILFLKKADLLCYRLFNSYSEIDDTNLLINKLLVNIPMEGKLFIDS